MKSKTLLVGGALFVTSIWLILAYFLQKQLIAIYQSWESPIITDRQSRQIAVLPNPKGYWSEYLETIPEEIKQRLLRKEDKYFYYHPGINPISLLRQKGASTLTQQLAKILLSQERDRTLKNKVKELFYALSLETYLSKKEILKMYANSVYLGNQAQGLAEASRVYFGKTLDLLSDEEADQLISAIPSPTAGNPARDKKPKNNHRASDLLFELQSWLASNEKKQQLTIDRELSEKIREIVKINIKNLQAKKANNAAVIVVKLPENEILTLIGSPDPQSLENGYQINMLQEPRPIGSTIKPFIYLKAFEKGLRPYTLVDDREYKYITAIGFPLYPKNFDYQYRGEVSLHYALSNSLNVPSVKVLEYVGLDDFYNFLEKELQFKPVQELQNYQLGIALGALEMNLQDLAKYFTVFPNNGILKELKISSNQTSPEKEIAKPEFVQLVNKILNDRKTGIEQFGMKSELNLFQDNYGLKTGTSRDFKDSWVVGFTPDFLVGVWVGNADNSPTDEVSGQSGAGNIWSETMELLLNSPYNRKTPLRFDLLSEEFEDKTKENLDYGLPGDDYKKSLDALKEENDSLIIAPHQGDLYLLEERTQIILEARKDSQWFANGEFLGEDESLVFSPQKPGRYQIEAVAEDDSREKVIIQVVD